ncbi:CHAT domain-containing protein [Nonomuraea sp. NPDC049480]|uniref:CHAT domain-containing protein n=1 Tax=Nonomuraea sp. NPDC049480 TaxID=3364353 RepID=UPI0037905A18
MINRFGDVPAETRHERYMALADDLMSISSGAEMLGFVAAFPEFVAPLWWREFEERRDAARTEGDELFAHVSEMRAYLLRRCWHAGRALGFVQAHVVQMIAANERAQAELDDGSNAAVMRLMDLLGDLWDPESTLAERSRLLVEHPEVLSDDAWQLLEAMMLIVEHGLADPAGLVDDHMRDELDLAAQFLHASRTRGPEQGCMAMGLYQAFNATSDAEAADLLKTYLATFGTRFPDQLVEIPDGGDPERLTARMAQRSQMVDDLAAEWEADWADLGPTYLAADLDLAGKLLRERPLLHAPIAVATLRDRAGDEAGQLTEARIRLLERCQVVGIDLALAEARQNEMQTAMRERNRLMAAETNRLSGRPVIVVDRWSMAEAGLEMPENPFLDALATARSDSAYRTYLGNPGRDTLETALDVIDSDLAEGAEGGRRNYLLNMRAGGLRDRARFTGRVADVDAAIVALREAVATTPDGPDHTLYLANLGTTLCERHQMIDDVAALGEAVPMLHQAVDDTPADSPYLGERLYMLGHALFARHETSSDLQPLLDAGEVLERALGAVPADEPSVRDKIRTGLATTLWQQRKLGIYRGSDEYVIDLLRSCFTNTTLTDTDRAIAGFNLGLTLKQLDAADTEFRPVFEKVYELGAVHAPQSAWRAMSHLGDWYGDRGDHAVAAGYYRKALALMLRISEAQTVDDHGARGRGAMTSVTAAGAYALARSGRHREAAETLERGRATLLTRRLTAESADLSLLDAAGRHDLSTRYRQAAGQLNALTATERIRRTEIADRTALHRARDRLDQIIEEIRTVPGCAGFQKADAAADLATVSAARPLVYVAAARKEGQALIVTDDAVIPIFLPHLSESDLGGRVAAWLDSGDLDQPARVKALDDLTNWLYDAVMGPLSLELRQAEITLVCCGMLGLAPLHAAWTADQSRPSARRWVMDELSIAYAPNARTLHVAAQLAARAHDSGVLIVDEPSPVSAAPLTYSHFEARAAHRLPGPHMRLRHEQATRAAIVEALGCKTAAVAHLSCHGTANLAHPHRSALICAHDELLTLDDFFGIDLTGIRLAVLSACETARIGGADLDEALGFPAWLVHAGVPTVIGSLWRVPGAGTGELFSRFYDHLADGYTPRNALRRAQQAVRDTTVAEKNSYLRSRFGDVASPWPTLPDAARPYARPYFWAGFSYYGV